MAEIGGAGNRTAVAVFFPSGFKRIAQKRKCRGIIPGMMCCPSSAGEMEIVEAVRSLITLDAAVGADLFDCDGGYLGMIFPQSLQPIEDGEYDVLVCGEAPC